MKTLDQRMTRVEQLLEEMAEANRAMQAARDAADARMQAWFDRIQAERVEGEARVQAARAEADARLQAWFDRMRAERAEADARMQAARAEAEARMEAAQAKAEADFERLRLADEQARAQIVEDRRKWGELANRMGTLVEDIVAPSIPEVCRQVFGLDTIDSSAHRVRRTHRHTRSRQREFDHVVTAGDIVLVTEVKSTIRPRDIVTFVRVLEDIRAWLWEADGRRAVGALAGFSVDQPLVTAAERRGLLVFGLGTGLLRILNSPGFHPRQF